MTCVAKQNLVTMVTNNCLLVVMEELSELNQKKELFSMATNVFMIVIDLQPIVASSNGCYGKRWFPWLQE